MSQPVAIVIEDAPQIRRFVRGARESEGWVVHEAGTLRDGLAAAGTRQPDLLVHHPRSEEHTSELQSL